MYARCHNGRQKKTEDATARPHSGYLTCGRLGMILQFEHTMVAGFPVSACASCCRHGCLPPCAACRLAFCAGPFRAQSCPLPHRRAVACCCAASCSCVCPRRRRRRCQTLQNRPRQTPRQPPPPESARHCRRRLQPCPPHLPRCPPPRRRQLQPSHLQPMPCPPPAAAP